MNPRPRMFLLILERKRREGIERETSIDVPPPRASDPPPGRVPCPGRDGAPASGAAATGTVGNAETSLSPRSEGRWRARSRENTGSPVLLLLLAPAGDLTADLTAAAVQTAPHVPARMGCGPRPGRPLPLGPTPTPGDWVVVPGWLVLGRGEPSTRQSVCQSVYLSVHRDTGQTGQREKPQHHLGLWEDTVAETVSHEARGRSPGSVALGACPPVCRGREVWVCGGDVGSWRRQGALAPLSITSTY